MTHPRGTGVASQYLSAFRYHRAHGSTHVTVLRDLDLLANTVELMRSRVIIDMRAAGYPWREIGECLAMTESQVRHQYGGSSTT